MGSCAAGLKDKTRKQEQDKWATAVEGNPKASFTMLLP